MANEAETLRKDVEELRASLDKLTKDVSSIGKSVTEDLKARADRSTEDLRDRARATVGEFGARSRETAQAAEKTVRERPMQSVLVAFGAGLLLAQLLRRR